MGIIALAIGYSSVQWRPSNKRRKDVSRVQGQKSTDRLQLGSTTQQHYRKWYTMAQMIRQITNSLGNQEGNTTRTMTGLGLIGMTISNRLYSTYRKFGWTSVSTMGSGPCAMCGLWPTCELLVHSPLFRTELVWCAVLFLSNGHDNFALTWAKRVYDWSLVKCVFARRLC